MEQNSKCLNCGGVMTLNSEQAQFICPYCDNVVYIKQQPPKIKVEDASEKIALSTTVVLKKEGSIYRGASGTAGNLFFYTERFVFESHPFNFIQKKEEVTIFYDKIISADISSERAFTKVLKVKVDTGDVYEFYVKSIKTVQSFVNEKRLQKSSSAGREIDEKFLNKEKKAGYKSCWYIILFIILFFALIIISSL